MQRRHDELRHTTIEPFATNAAGSVVITQGRTKVLCTASLAQEVPAWMRDPATGTAARGWVTAEYAMLPGSTPHRKKRGEDSRASEIRRLIGRVLRSAVDLDIMTGLTVTCDCDVLVADGGTRTASITGSFVALVQAIRVARRRGLLADDPILGPVAAVSVGLVGGQPWLDLDYALDSTADVDMNVAMNHEGGFVEVQATGEQGTFSRAQLDHLLDQAAAGIGRLMEIQQEVIDGF